MKNEITIDGIEYIRKMRTSDEGKKDSAKRGSGDKKKEDVQKPDVRNDNSNKGSDGVKPDTKRAPPEKEKKASPKKNSDS